MIYSRGNFTANPSQSSAITHPIAPLMIIAGAGTGKTTTLLHRNYYLIEKYKIAPENILTITYTEKAAAELKNRIINNIGDTAKAMTISTFHSFCYNIVKQYSLSNNSSPILIDSGDAVYMFMQNFDSLGPFESQLFASEPIKAITRSFIPFIDRLRDELIDPAQKPIPNISENIDESTIAQLSDLKRIFPIYQKWKQDQNLVDFGDMILKCYDLFNTDNDVLHNVQNQYRYIVIDEFQDNNFALNEVVTQIVGKTGNITVVGDEDQVVYSFRGASKYNISSFRRRYSKFKGYAEISLAENFRSTQQILDVANNSISNSAEGLRKNLQAVKNKSGPKPQLINADNKNHPSLIADKINELSSNTNLNDIAVLCRTKAQVKTIADELNRNSISTRTFLIDFFKISEIKDILAWCNIIAESNEQDASLYRLISKQIGLQYAKALFSQYSKRDYTPRIELIKNESNPELIGLLELISDLKIINQKKTASEMVWEICERTKILRPLNARYEYNDQLAILNIGQFIARSNEFTSRHKNDSSLLTFCRYIKVLQDFNSIQSKYPAEKHAMQSVLVNTIHGVKGGEYPIVFIPFNRVQSFPLNYKKSVFTDYPPADWLIYQDEYSLTPKELHMEEERRLFYVGITRAKEELYLYAPPKYTSKFINELNKDLVEVITMDNNENIQESHSDLRIAYEKRLSKTLSLNQFDKSNEILKAIQRIDNIERGAEVTWTDSDWENELKNQLPNNVEKEALTKLNLSASSIETYEQCPLKYRLSNIDKIPQISSKPQLTFGNIIHNVLEQFHSPNTELNEERLLTLLDANWESLGFDYSTQEDDFKRQGKELLSRYWKDFQNNPADVIEREFQFSFDLHDITINGKIDRIDKGDVGYRVIDYKTSKSATDAKKSTQLAIYSLFLQQAKKDEYGGIPESALLYFLREEEPIREHKFTQEELDQISNRIVDIAGKIRNDEFGPCKGFHCDWCDYKNLLCPGWEES